MVDEQVWSWGQLLHVSSISKETQECSPFNEKFVSGFKTKGIIIPYAISYLVGNSYWGGIFVGFPYILYFFLVKDVVSIK